MPSDFDFTQDSPSPRRGSYRMEAPGRTGCALGFGWTIGVMLALVAIPVAGFGVCAGLGGLGLIMARKNADTETRDSKEKKDSEKWFEPSVAVKIGEAEVMIDTVRLGKVALTSLGRNGTSKDEYLALDIIVKNAHQTRKMEYKPWGGQLFNDSPARLSDDFGNRYKIIYPGFGEEFVGAADRKQSIYPGKQIRDLLVFQPPVDRAANVDLVLPGENVGAKGEIRFRIPTRIIARIKDKD